MNSRIENQKNPGIRRSRVGAAAGGLVRGLFLLLVLSLVVFFLVKSLNKLTELGKKKEEAAPAEPPKPSNEELLLTEIRDLLKEQK